MASRKKITISWSGGKDSAMAPYKILLSQDFEVVSLHTIFNSESHRVGLHGIHERLIEAQALSIGIPLVRLYLKTSESHNEFELLMSSFYRQCVREGIDAVAFGDIFLEDLKNYRETLLTTSQLKGVFPLWQIESKMLVQDFINAGFKTIVCSADANHFTKRHAGSVIDGNFIDSLPGNVDACGENGEFHTFVCDGPVFKTPILFSKGEVVLRWYNYNKITESGATEECRAAFWFQEIYPRTDE